MEDERTSHHPISEATKCDKSDTEHLLTKRVSGSGELPTREQVQARFLKCACREQLEEVDHSAADLLVASTKIMLANMIEAATRLRRNYVMDSNGFTHSYGTCEEAKISANDSKCSFGGIAPELIPPNKTNITSRDIMEAARFDRKLRLNTELRTMLNKHLSVAQPHPSKAKRKKNSVTSSSKRKRVTLILGGEKRVVDGTGNREPLTQRDNISE